MLEYFMHLKLIIIVKYYKAKFFVNIDMTLKCKRVMAEFSLPKLQSQSKNLK